MKGRAIESDELDPAPTYTGPPSNRYTQSCPDRTSSTRISNGFDTAAVYIRALGQRGRRGQALRQRVPRQCLQELDQIGHLLVGELQRHQRGSLALTGETVGAGGLVVPVHHVPQVGEAARVHVGAGPADVAQSG